MGTYECCAAVSDLPADLDAAIRYNLNSYCHMVPDKYVTLALFPAGLVCRWFMENFSDVNDLVQARKIHDEFDRKIISEVTGPTGLYLTAFKTNAFARNDWEDKFCKLVRLKLREFYRLQCIDSRMGNRLDYFRIE